MPTRTPSPIEASLRAAFLEAWPAIIDVTHLESPAFLTDHLHRLQPSSEIRIRQYGAPEDGFLFSQARCAGYHVDLLLWSTWISLAIECDGFDFHDRTPQQAAYDRARDRELIRAGATVIRFAGSEIYRDPDQCAAEIIKTWESLVDRWNAHADHLERLDLLCKAMERPKG